MFTRCLLQHMCSMSVYCSTCAACQSHFGSILQEKEDQLLSFQDALNSLHVKLVHDMLKNGADIQAVTSQVELQGMLLYPCLGVCA